MDYTEFDVPIALRRHIDCVWRLRDDHPGPEPQTIYPDGRCELIVHLATPMRLHTLAQGWQTQAPCLFAAQLRSAIRLAATAAVDCIGIRLQPAASAAIARTRLPDLVDDIVDLHTLDAEFADALSTTCKGIDGDHSGLWPLLQARIGKLQIDGRIEAAVQALDAAHGDLAIAALAIRVGASLRSVQTRFLEQVGLTAKEYARIQRLQTTLHHLDGSAESLSQLAADTGFADQAHATRELQRLTGLTPARLRAALRAEREGDATLRMAAAFVRGQAG